MDIGETTPKNFVIRDSGVSLRVANVFYDSRPGDRGKDSGPIWFNEIGRRKRPTANRETPHLIINANIRRMEAVFFASNLSESLMPQITSDVPASFLQEHNNVEVLYCD